VPYHSNGMRLTKKRTTDSHAAAKSADFLFRFSPRRPACVFAALCLFVLQTGAWSQNPQLPNPQLPGLHDDEDHKLPNGKSQKDAMAKSEHDKALKEANDLLQLAQQLKDEIQKAGDHVVPMSSVKKTEEIEKMARRIRSRLTE
jgi:hypothetical protein